MFNLESKSNNNRKHKQIIKQQQQYYYFPNYHLITIWDEGRDFVNLEFFFQNQGDLFKEARIFYFFDYIGFIIYEGEVKFI